MKNSKIEKELKRIARSNGGLLLPEKVVEAARPKTSPIHSRFEWDDSEAADRYRLWQARQLIKVCVEQVQGVSKPTEVFVSLKTDRADAGGYRITTDVLSDEEMKAQLLRDAVEELQIFKIKYRRLKELSDVFDAIDKIAA